MLGLAKKPYHFFFLLSLIIFQCAPTVKFLGDCDRVFLEEIGDTQVVVFDKYSERGYVATIIVRGSSHSRMDDVERAIDDAVNTYKALTRDPRVNFCQIDENLKKFRIFLKIDENFRVILNLLLNLAFGWCWCS